MQRERIITKDGSDTISIPELGVTYHSLHGAIQESAHVYIITGLEETIKRVKTEQVIRVFEMGLGTGLNTLLTIINAHKNNISVYYECVEAYPLSSSEIQQLNYCEKLNEPILQSCFERLHTCEWATKTLICPGFEFCKHPLTLFEWQPSHSFHLIYYDAFAPSAQPELWTQAVFTKLYKCLVLGGILVTYCSKGDVRRNAMTAGFKVEKLAGPPGKREIIRGEKLY